MDSSQNRRLLSILPVCLLLFPLLMILAINLVRDENGLSAQFLLWAAKALFFVLAIAGWGALGANLLHAKSRYPERLLVLITLGAGITYVLCIVLLLIGQFKTWPILPVLVVGVGLLAQEAPLWRGFSLFPRPLTRSENFLFGLVLLLCGIRVVCGWTPLVSYDLLVYQLFTPAQYLSHNHFVYLPMNVYTNSPLGLQLLLGSSLVLDRSGQTAKLLITITSLLLPAAAAFLVADSGRKASATAAILVLAYPAFWLADVMGSIDLTAAGFLTIGAYWLRKTLLSEQTRRVELVLAAVALGLAVSSRYQMILMTVVCITLLSIEVFVKSQKRLDVFKRLAIIVLIPAAMILPWLVKNLVYTGNAIFPLAFQAFGGTDWSLDQAVRLHHDVMGDPLSALPWSYQIKAFVSLLLKQPENGFLGPVILIVSILSLFRLTSNSRWIVVCMGLIMLVIWGMVHPAVDVTLFRFNAGAVAFLMAGAAAFLWEKFKTIGVVCVLLVGLSSVTATIHDLTVTYPVYQAITNHRFRDSFRQDSIPGLTAFRFANARLNPDRDKILLIGETRGFSLRIPCICPSAFNGPQIAALFSPINDQERWRENLQKAKISHILVSLTEWQHLYSKGYYNYLGVSQRISKRSSSGFRGKKSFLATERETS